MNPRSRILRALLCGTWAAGLGNFLAELATLSPAVQSLLLPGVAGPTEWMWAVRIFAVLCGMSAAGLVLWYRENWGPRTQFAILGAAGAAGMLFAVSLALEGLIGPGSLDLLGQVGSPLSVWSSRGMPALSVNDWAVCSIPAALVMGAAAGIVLANICYGSRCSSRLESGLATNPTAAH